MLYNLSSSIKCGSLSVVLIEHSPKVIDF